MTSCLPLALAEAQRPRILAAPPASNYASGWEAIELAESVGLILDPWQKLALLIICAENELGLWAAFECALLVARQNGKGGVIEARELAGLFLFGERLIIHSAHRFETSAEAFLRMINLIEGCPDLDRRVKRVSRSHGHEGIELRTGQRIKYRTRSGAGGRGLSGDFVVLDEAMYLAVATMSALLFTMGARPNPQLLYAGSAVDQREHVDGVTFTRIRHRGIAGQDPSLAYLEWSPPVTIDQVEAGQIDLSHPRLLEQSNPALDIRITREHTANERRTIPAREYAIERLSIGDWPDVSQAGTQVIDSAMWAALTDPGVGRLSPVAFGVTVSPDRAHTRIGLAGRRADGLDQVELIAEAAGIDWAVGWLSERVRRWDPCAVVLDGTASGLLIPLADVGIEAVATTSQDRAQATVDIYDAITQRRLRHTGGPALAGAVECAQKRPIGGRWVWEGAGVGPLQAVTLALHGLLVHGRPAPPPAEPQLASNATTTSETADLARASF